MQGLTHYGVNDFEIADSAYSMKVKEQADKLRKDAEGKVPVFVCFSGAVNGP